MTGLSDRLARAPAWTQPAMILVAAAGCLTTVAAADPTAPANVLPKCPLRMTTGLWCPLCGSTRMLYVLLHGDVRLAARYNVVALAALPFLAYAYLGYAVRKTTGRRLPGRLPGARVWWALGGLLVAFAVARNLPFAPFTALRG